MLMPKNAYGAEMILQKQAGKGSSKHTFQLITAALVFGSSDRPDQ